MYKYVSKLFLVFNLFLEYKYKIFILILCKAYMKYLFWLYEFFKKQF